MKIITTGLLLILALLCVVKSCDIQVKLVSHTKKPFKFQVVVPSLKIKTEEIELRGKKEKRLIKITGKNCAGERWIFRMWKVVKGRWKLAQVAKNRLEGKGWIQIEVNDVPQFYFHGAFGVLTSGY